MRRRTIIQRTTEHLARALADHDEATVHQRQRDRARSKKAARSRKRLKGAKEIT